MAKDLTVAAIERTKPGKARQEVPDGHTRGLYYVVQPSGAGSWAYRYRFGGKPKKLTLGGFPAISLKTARELASDAASAVARGEDPAANKQAAKAAAKAHARKEDDTIEKVVDAFVERYAKKQTRESSWREAERILRREIVGPWKGRRLGEISRVDVHGLVDPIVERAPILANRTLAALRRLCGWAVERGIIQHSPCEKVRAPVAEHSRDRVLTDDEIRLAWCAFEAAGWPFGPLAKLLLVTAARRDEVASMSWQEVDLAARTWVIPKERVKNGIAHEIPLSDAAIRILDSLPRIGGSVGPIFTTNGRTAVSGFSKFKAQVDAAILAAMGAGVEPPERWTLHDLRRTAASGMAGLGVPPHHIEAVLNHRGGIIKGVAAIYNRYSYSAEKRSALDSWGQALDAILSGRADKVVELTRTRGVRSGR